jgi:hypothetical protein|tara:strand:- start:1310 stop:1717 length:408 start_codon:yes stop_codon:yes gene_type:complete
MSYNTFEDDTRLVMTILFVGAVSGVNVYFFATFGAEFLTIYGPYTLAILFGVLTVGGIMILKSLFDLVLNEYIEDFLLQRSINTYWARKAKDEENRKRVRESMRQYEEFRFRPIPQQQQYVDENVINPSFLMTEQ